MPIAPTYLARATRSSTSPIDASHRVIHLYRRLIRSVPSLCDLYELDQSAATVRTKIRQEFERHRFVNDVPVIDLLLAKGQMEYQEAANFWKQAPHLKRIFQEYETRSTPPKSFLHRFLDGTA